MANMDQGSMGNRRSVLAFAIAAISIALLIVVGVAGESMGPNTRHANRRVVILAIKR